MFFHIPLFPFKLVEFSLIATFVDFYDFRGNRTLTLWWTLGALENVRLYVLLGALENVRLYVLTYSSDQDGYLCST